MESKTAEQIDSLLNLFMTKPNKSAMVWLAEITQHLKDKGFLQGMAQSDEWIHIQWILQVMYDMGYIHVQSDLMPNSHQRMYIVGAHIVAQGYYLLLNGGLEKKVKQEQDLIKLQKDQVKSSIKTDESVRSTNEFQWIMAILTALFIAGNLWIDWLSYNTQKTQLEEQRAERIENKKQQTQPPVFRPCPVYKSGSTKKDTLK